MAKRTKRHRSEESLVQCDRCDRWLHLDETGFPDLEAASAASPFTCKPCVTVESLHARLRSIESDVATMHERQRTTESDMEALRALVAQLQSRLQSEVPVLVATIPPEKEPQEPNGQPEVSPEPGSELAIHPTGECMLSHEKNAAEVAEPVETVTDAAPENRQHERDRTPGTPENKDEAATNHSVERGAYATKDRDHTAARSQEVGSRHNPTNKVGRKPKKSNRSKQNVQKPETDNAANPTKEILVCGDKSIARIAAALRYQLNGRVSIKLRIAKTPTSCAAQRLLQRYCDRAGEKNRLVIFHAGAKDAVSDAQSAETLRVIRDLVIPSSPDLIVCSIPEVAAHGKEAQARAVLVNVQLKELCDTLGAPYLDISKVAKDNGGVELDGKYLSAETSYCVAAQVAKLAELFLGGRKPKRDKQYSAGRHRTAPTESYAFQGKTQAHPQQSTDGVPPQSTRYTRALKAEERVTQESTSARPLELHRSQHLPNQPNVMTSPLPVYMIPQSPLPAAARIQGPGVMTERSPPQTPYVCGHMPIVAWARRIFRYVSLKGIRTKWLTRLQTLRRKFGFFANPINEDTERKWKEAVQTRVQEEETARWNGTMMQKSTLTMYRSHKKAIAAERLYDNGIGSSLLFEARAGALRTLVYRRRYETSPDATTAMCRICSAEEEDVEHLVLRCTGLSPRHAEGTDLSTALGFTDSDSSATSDMVDVVSTSKERLRKWWLETWR
ncbi:hypothetical protein HPB50_026601 [Hyalomma asiaticum]|uniref:Uncharacterized protein n=1 Tax=Hyalomma asiaticum TaxID=266040 RepID=A0ACB7TPK1_HYAAI|nr:hypothetical protein HPB50_026601 [Hyalomma asiaticum]